MSIEVKNVSKIYGSQKALNNVSFNVNPGEITGFLGPNGAGKSTMMKIITCYLPQSSGDVKVCGHDVSTNSVEVRKHIGYLPEHNPLYLDMYIKEYLEFIAGIHKVSKSKIPEMIEMTGLGREQNKLIGALSKGYRQRVGIAQALIHDPKVLILDEPTTGLDPNQLVDIRKLIKDIGREKTVMLSTHIMQEVEAICDRVIIVNKGNMVANQATGDLQRSSGNQQIITVEFGKQLENKVFKTIPEIKNAENIKGNLWRLTVQGNKDIRSEIFNIAVSQNTIILHLTREELKLEDVFHQLTK